MPAGEPFAGDAAAAAAAVPAAAAAAEGSPSIMGLLSQHPGVAATPGSHGHDYLQTTTITEVPPSMCGGVPFAAAAAAQQQRTPLAAGTTVFGMGGAAASPAVTAFKVESPTAAAAAAAAAAAPAAAAAAGGGGHGGAGAAMDGVVQQPRVDSPPDDMDMNMHDLLANLSSVPSSELMFMDDPALKGDDVWDALFGKGGSSGLASPGGAAAAGGADGTVAGHATDTGLLGGS
jgi:hypothetical protein